MKFIKYLLLLVVVLLIVGFGYTSFQPSDYDIERSKVIKAPISKVFNTVDEMKTWEKWGPWHDEDTTIVVTYGDKTSGVGAYNSWVSKDGPGNMTTVKTVMNQRIEQKMQFEDFEPSDVIWTFEPTEEGTKVTWQMKEDNAPFVFKLASAFMGGWDKMLGPMQEQGLANLADVIAAMPDDFSVGKVSVSEMEAQKFIGYFHKTKIDMEAMTTAFNADLPKAGMYAMQKGLKPGEYVPGAVYTKWDEEAQEAEFYIGLLITKEVKPAEGMQEVALPAGKVAKVSKFGPYGNGDYEAHMALESFIKKQNGEKIWPIWETYVNDPSQVKPSEIQTDIFYAFK